MSTSRFVLRVTPLSILLVAAAIACADSKSVAPDGGASPIQGLVGLQSPDTSGGGSSSSPSQGDGFFRGVVQGYSEAAFPDTLKSMKPLANVSVTAYPAELTNAEPKLGPATATVLTNGEGQFTFSTLPGRLYVVTFVPPSGSPYASGWTQATANPQSGDRSWTIMLRAK